MEDTWTHQLVGRIVEAIEASGDYLCRIQFPGGYRIQVESLWRLMSSGTLVLTSADDGQFFGHQEPVRVISRLSKVLLGKKLDALEVARGTADLTLYFGEHTLQVVSDSCGFEAWQVVGPEGTKVVGLGGGQVAVGKEITEHAPKRAR